MVSKLRHNTVSIPSTLLLCESLMGCPEDNPHYILRTVNMFAREESYLNEVK